MLIYNIQAKIRTQLWGIKALDEYTVNISNVPKISIMKPKKWGNEDGPTSFWTATNLLIGHPLYPQVFTKVRKWPMGEDSEEYNK